MQPLHAIDHDRVGARAGDARSHIAQQLGQANHFRLARRLDDLRAPLGEDRGEHQVFRAQHGREVEKQRCTAQAPLRLCDDPAVGIFVNRCAELSEAVEMNVQRALADVVATRARAFNAAESPPQQRADKQERRALRLHQIVERDFIQPIDGSDGDLYRGRFAVMLSRRADPAQQLAESTHIFDVGDALDDRCFVRQQCGCQTRHRRVFRTGDLDLPAQAAPADNAQRGIIRTRVHRRTLTHAAPTRPACWLDEESDESGNVGRGSSSGSLTGTSANS